VRKVAYEVNCSATGIVDLTKEMLFDVLRFLSAKPCCVKILFGEAVLEALLPNRTSGMGNASRINEKAWLEIQVVKFLIFLPNRDKSPLIPCRHIVIVLIFVGHYLQLIPDAC